MKAEQIQRFFMPSSLYPSPENKWLWIRIHKNAGTSMFDPFLIEHCYNSVKRNPEAKVERWMSDLTNESLKDYFIWSFVRNPYDRFISIATMFKCEPNYFAVIFRNLKKPMIKRHSQPQHRFTHDKGISNCNFLGRFENLQPDFDVVCDMIGVKRFKLPKLNATKHGHYKQILTRNTMNFIERKYKLDFEYYGY